MKRFSTTVCRVDGKTVIYGKIFNDTVVCLTISDGAESLIANPKEYSIDDFVRILNVVRKMKKAAADPKTCQQLSFL